MINHARADKTIAFWSLRCPDRRQISWKATALVTLTETCVLPARTVLIALSIDINFTQITPSTFRRKSLRKSENQICAPMEIIRSRRAMDPGDDDADLCKKKKRTRRFDSSDDAACKISRVTRRDSSLSRFHRAMRITTAPRAETNANLTRERERERENGMKHKKSP